ncbi:valine N-monooxygenase 2-like [Tripterygium wilfordii]|uniref:valine N-monooxygenase 2-like n=1 Tax=Tripterygium wilfordii TaxID=458696 RepID=UPI0018F82E7A|nr:valine N-monooxygenase 2-like [Tripterygium wilfordii]
MTTNITTATLLSIPTSTTTTTTTTTSTSTNTNIKALIIVFLVTIIGVLKLKQKSTFRKVRKGPPLPPGPTPWSIVGNIPEMLCFKPTFRWVHQMMKDMNTDIACIRLGNTNFIPVTCPEIAREMLKKQDANFTDRPLSISAHAVSGGYMTAVTVPLTEQGKKMRKILVSEIICHARHKWLHDKRVEESDNLVFYVHNQYKNNKDVNIRIATQHYCGNVVRKILFSRTYFGEPMKDGGPGPDEIKHVEAVFTALKYVYSFCVSDYLPFLRGLNIDGQEQIAKDANKTVRDYQNPIVDERYEEWRTGQRKEMEDLLDVFITLKNSDDKPLLTPDEIKNQATRSQSTYFESQTVTVMQITGNRVAAHTGYAVADCGYDEEKRSATTGGHTEAGLEVVYLQISGDINCFSGEGCFQSGNVLEILAFWKTLKYSSEEPSNTMNKPWTSWSVGKPVSKNFCAMQLLGLMLGPSQLGLPI